jgi:hypothetical protein
MSVIQGMGWKFLDRIIIEITNLGARSAQASRADYSQSAFDGTEYTPIEFYKNTKEFFSSPAKFYLTAESRDLPAQEIAGSADAKLMMIKSAYKSQFHENDNVYFEYLSSEQAPKPICLVFLTGWLRSNTRTEFEFCKSLSAAGVDAAIISAPYSLQRTPAGWRSGEYFITPDLFASVGNFRQAISDIVSVVSWLKARGSARIILFGLSVGGILAELVANVCPAAGLILVASGCNLAEIVWTSRETVALRRGIETQGYGQDDVRQTWSICDPLVVGRSCQVPRDRIILFRTLYDEVIPPANQDQLWEVLDRPRRIDLSCAHYSVAWFLGRIRNAVIESIA